MRPLNANGNPPPGSLICPYPNLRGHMSGEKEIACGVDVHNKFIVATILSSGSLKLQDRFETNLEELLKFKDWLKENGCHKVALESTGNYWLPIYNVLEGSVDFILANAYQTFLLRRKGCLL